MGFDGWNGVLESDIKLAMNGHVKDGYKVHVFGYTVYHFLLLFCLHMSGPCFKYCTEGRWGGVGQVCARDSNGRRHDATQLDHLLRTGPTVHVRSPTHKECE